ncbi:MAG: UDP-N-acetylmuramoyl-L-alanyl-D-glutamate--2,6-diaminopimelate ligase [Pseudomonadales bacterium]
MSLSASQWLQGLEFQGQPGSVVVTGLTDDSRRVSPGDCFVAVAGAASDGHEYASAAVAAGAVLVLAERALPNLVVPVLLHPQLAQLRSELAARFYNRPSEHLRIVGITGTNGKTSVAHYTAELAERLGVASGYMGTVGWGRPGRLEDAALTTVDAITLQQRLADFVQQDCELAVLEVSSHALVQHRLASVATAVAVFTNLTRDHLDFHGSFENYAEAKLQLFQRTELQTVVTNVEDPLGLQIATQMASREGVRLVCCGSDEATAVAGASVVQWSGLRFASTSIEGEWRTSWGTAPFSLPLLGEFAVANVAAALAVMLSEGVEFSQAVSAANRLQGVPGRMERFAAPGRPTVVVDYAHTPDALAKALTALRCHSSARLLVVFGCGGDRDRGKRSQMGSVCAELADLIYLTSDNPRSEDPEKILDDIAVGIPAGTAVRRVADRQRAITEAVAAADNEDLILVAGKGHEDYQEIAGQRRAFSDRMLVQSLLGEAA